MKNGVTCSSTVVFVTCCCFFWGGFWVSFGEDIMTLQFKRLVVEGTPIFW